MFFFFFKQKTAYEMRISDWSSDVCSSDLPVALTLIVIAAVLMMMPLFWVLALSFKANAALMADTNSVFSLPYTLANYRTLFGDGQVFRWIMNSLIVSQIGRAECRERVCQ